MWPTSLTLLSPRFAKPHRPHGPHDWRYLLGAQAGQAFNRFISGLFWEAGVFENDYRWSTDAMVPRLWVAKVCDRGGRVCVERVDPIASLGPG